ncbi:MAG: GNAT family N-acetyltransferase [Planctomycetota bacterium]
MEAPLFPAQLLTERLLMRVAEPDDAPEVNAAITASLAELGRWLDWARAGPGAAETRAFLVEARGRFEARAEVPVLCFVRDGGALCGGGGIQNIRWDERSFEIGYWLRTSQTGRGYATELTHALTDHCLRSLGAKRVEILCSDRNAASRRVAERAGYALERIVPQDRTDPDGVRAGSCVYVARPGYGEIPRKLPPPPET